jgi:hypothetical protein
MDIRTVRWIFMPQGNRQTGTTCDLVLSRNEGNAAFLQELVPNRRQKWCAFTAVAKHAPHFASADDESAPLIKYPRYNIDSSSKQT